MPPADGADDQRISTVDAAAASLQSAGGRLRILMLADDAHPANAVVDHIKSIKRHSRHHVTVLNPVTSRRGWFMAALRFDVIVIHYSICILYDYYLPSAVAAAVRAFPGPKIQIIQDEHRWIDRMVMRMSELEIGAVFSSLSPENIARVYHHPHLAKVRFFSSLPGYVPDRLRRIRRRPLSQRPYHLVYRGRPLPIRLGKFSQEKVQIGLQAQAMAQKYGLNVDCKVGEDDRVYGTQWNELLMTGRAALATQGGATVFDFDESVERKFEKFREDNPNASAEETWEAVVKPYDGNVVHKTITPRVLEAIMCRTALVMYPGEYRGILQPWEHYIPLNRDGSNEAEVAELLQNDAHLEELIERAYWRIADDPGLQFSQYVAAIDATAIRLSGEARSPSIESGNGARSYAEWAPLRFGLKVAERRISAFSNPYTLTYRLSDRVSTVARAPSYILRKTKSATRRLRKRLPVFLRPPGDQDVRGDGLRVAGDDARSPETDVNKLNVLILCSFDFRHIGTVRDHLEAFRKYSRHTVCVADALSMANFEIDFDKFDVVALHYTVVISMQRYLPLPLAQKIREFRGYKVLFIQDEYRWVDRTVAATADLGVDVISSVINEDAIDKVYHHPSIRHVRRTTTLTGFVPEELTRRKVPSFREREIDVGYRARRVPAWIGSFSQEKWLIGARFKQEAEAYGLVCDIEDAESRRLYGEKWIAFVGRCKAMLGTESGASFIDFTGEVQPAVEAFERANPDADFAEISKRFLNGDGDIVIRVISPRCFEAAALRTLMILYPGTYSGVLEPWRHYVPLERDHSNMDEVVAVLRDPERASAIIDCAYREVALNPKYSFKAMVDDFDRDLERHAPTVSFSTVRRGASRSAAPADRSVEAIRKLERRIEWKYWVRRAPHINTRQVAYRMFNWGIRVTVPERKQQSVRTYLKTVAEHIGVLK